MKNEIHDDSLNGVIAIEGISHTNGASGTNGINGYNGHNGHSNGRNGHNGRNGATPEAGNKGVVSRFFKQIKSIF
jgi:hypothetical protein